jgi:steroid delta-isomerase-like uncharacterized protein
MTPTHASRHIARKVGVVEGEQKNVSGVNKALIRRLFEEGINQHDVSVMSDLYENCLYRAPGAGALKADAHMQFLVSLLTAFPDCHVTIEEQLAEGNKVVTRWTFRATHKAEFIGVPATGRTIAITGIAIHQIVNGKIVEDLQEWDTLALMRQLGMLPSRGAAMVTA